MDEGIYTAECGIGGVGRPPSDATGQIEACVVDRIARRTAELRAMAQGVGYPAPPDGQDGYRKYPSPGAAGVPRPGRRTLQEVP